MFWGMARHDTTIQKQKTMLESGTVAILAQAILAQAILAQGMQTLIIIDINAANAYLNICFH